MFSDTFIPREANGDRRQPAGTRGISMEGKKTGWIGTLAVFLLAAALLAPAGTAWASEAGIQEDGSPAAGAESQGAESLAAEEAEGSWSQAEDIGGKEVPAGIAPFSLEENAASFGNCYGDQLSQAEQVIYQALEQGDLAEAYETPRSLELRENKESLYLFGMAYTQEQWDQKEYLDDPDYQALRSQAEQAFLRAYDAYLKDHTEETYWASGLTYQFTLGLAANQNDGSQRLVISKVSLSPSLYYQGILSEREAVLEALDEAEQEIGSHLESGAGRSEILGAIHDWLTYRITYGTASPSQSAHTITGALLETYGHRGVCEAYSKLFQIFCDRWGIPCVTAVGRSASGVSQVDHMWNYVQLEDGAWYLVDVTWDDQEGEPSREWFLAGAGQSAGTHLFTGVFTDFQGKTPYEAFVQPELAAANAGGESRIHVWSEGESQAAGCVSGGWQEYVCTCGASYRETTEEALGHSWGSWQTVAQPTTASSGRQQRTCARCGQKEERSTDPLPATQENLVTEFVNRLYQMTLDRTPTQAEARDWVNRLLDRSFSGAQVAGGFVFSAEYNRKNTPDGSYVKMLYQTMLGREPRTDEVAFWTGYLDRGVTRGFVFQGFTGSVEFARLCGNYGIEAGSWHSEDIRDQNPDVTAFVTRLYRTCMGREPDESGLIDWVTWILNGSQSGSQVAHGFVFSAEFQRKQLDDSAFVEALYRALFDRSSDASGKKTWMDCLSSGWSRQQVLEGFLGSEEFSRLCQRYGIQK